MGKKVMVPTPQDRREEEKAKNHLTNKKLGTSTAVDLLVEVSNLINSIEMGRSKEALLEATQAEQEWESAMDSQVQ